MFEGPLLPELQQYLYLFVKGGMLLLTGMYIIFSLVMLRQVQIMMNVLTVPISFLFQVFLWGHAALAILVFLFAILFI